MYKMNARDMIPPPVLLSRTREVHTRKICCADLTTAGLLTRTCTGRSCKLSCLTRSVFKWAWYATTSRFV